MLCSMLGISYLFLLYDNAMVSYIVWRTFHNGRKKNQDILVIQSASSAAWLIHIIQPLLPVSQLPTSPLAQPFLWARGDKIPQPTTAPKSICSVTNGPAIIPCPTKPGEMSIVHSHLLAMLNPKKGIFRRIGKNSISRPYSIN